jgi:hypothetical protein
MWCYWHVLPMLEQLLTVHAGGDATSLLPKRRQLE